MSLRKALLGITGLIFVCALAVSGQEPQSQTQTAPDTTLRPERMERGARQRHRREAQDGMRAGEDAGMGRWLRELDLSEAQRQQVRAIVERREENTRVQREELLKLREKRIDGTLTADDEARASTLRQEIRTATEGVRNEIAGVLTAEQKARLEQLRQERKLRIEQRVKERQERLQPKPQ
jgi:periplasmic protein CpxP/Spy